jgi:hypothetical protein
VRIGYERWLQALEYRVMFSIPTNTHHTFAQFEALTGYLPPEFDTFWQFNPATQKLEALSDGPGEINNPVVLATKNGRHAIGIFAPPPNEPNTTGPAYGRWRFKAEYVVKWNCVFRLRKAEGLPSGDYSYRMLVPIGTRNEVEAMLREWMTRRDLPAKSTRPNFTSMSPRPGNRRGCIAWCRFHNQRPNSILAGGR